MGKSSTIPDAWDDDWEGQADKAEKTGQHAEVPAEVKITKAERLARHAETNKKLWKSADEPETFHFLASRDDVPLKSEFKPALKVLSRKPTPTLMKRIDPVTGLENLSLDDDEDEGEQKQVQPSAEELRRKVQRDREDRQKRYDEARARILGTASGSSTPGATTPPTDDTRAIRSKGRGRGGVGGGQLGVPRSDSQGGQKEKLYDPNYTSKPGTGLHGRNGEGSGSGRSTPREEDQLIRTPRGPDASGKGFGFVKRGGATT